MKIDPPEWRLKQICPCCYQGRLILNTCSNCNKTVTICEEVEPVFSATRKLIDRLKYANILKLHWRNDNMKRRTARYLKSILFF